MSFGCRCFCFLSVCFVVAFTFILFCLVWFGLVLVWFGFDFVIREDIFWLVGFCVCFLSMPYKPIF